MAKQPETQSNFIQPLADQMRPHNLSKFVGQENILQPGKPLREIIERKIPISLLFWGPPGTGKTSLARIIAKHDNLDFESFNASIDNKAKLTKIIKKHQNETFVLLVDELHRLTKTLQDFLLPYLESGHIMLIGATTENPIMSMVPAVRSRCQIFEFKAISDQDILKVLKRATKKLDIKNIDEKALKIIAIAADGDVRVGLNLLETSHAIHPDSLRTEDVKRLLKSQRFSYDKKATKHYDYLSAYSGSMAGSDTDAALYYLSVLLENGDLPSVVRRLREIPYTYIGLANPQQVTQIVIAANQAEKIGMPKAKYPLTFATILMCIAPKSASLDTAYNMANQDSKFPSQHPMPRGLRDAHYKHSEEITGGGLMQSPFDSKHMIAKENHMPKGLKGRRYYWPSNNPNKNKLLKQYLTLHKYIYGEDYKNE